MRAVGYWLQFLISSLFQAQSLSGGTFPWKSIGFHLMTPFRGPTLFSGHRRPRDGALKQQKEPNCFIGYEGLLFSPINSALHQPFLCPPTTLVSPTKTFRTATIEKNGQPSSDSFFPLQHPQWHSFIPVCIHSPPPHPHTHSDPRLNPGGRNLFGMFLVQLEYNKKVIRPQKMSLLVKMRSQWRGEIEFFAVTLRF